MFHQHLNSTVITITTTRSVMLYTYMFTKQHEHCDWLFLGNVPLINFKSSYSCCPLRVFCKIKTAKIDFTYVLSQKLWIGIIEWKQTILKWNCLWNWNPLVAFFPMKTSEECNNDGEEQNNWLQTWVAWVVAFCNIRNTAKFLSNYPIIICHVYAVFALKLKLEF